MNRPPAPKLIEIDWPDFGPSQPPSATPAKEFERRLRLTRAAMERSRLTHLIIYADREHFANLAYLTGFDPRFEEAVLILADDRNPLLLVGNECTRRLPVSPLYASGGMRSELFQSFSLLNQPRDASRRLKDILSAEGIGRNSRVGCVGWKYFAETEQPEASLAIELPAYLVDSLRDLAGRRAVVNATAIFMNPASGLRTFCSASEIAYLEYMGSLASESVKRIIFALRDGMTDHQLVQAACLNGEPLGAHPSVKTEATRRYALVSPTGAVIRRGQPLSMGICYWGGNSCRAGWAVSSARQLPREARGYVDQFAGPYFGLMGAWIGALKLGALGGSFCRLVADRLPFEQFGITLNPGHLTHLDEWVSSPFYPGSTIKLHSGMAIQTDIIPSSSVYFSSRMEDGVVLANAGLRRQLKEKYPACFARCQARRRFMIETLGFAVAEEVLPLSNIPGLVPPFFLNPNLVFAFKSLERRCDL
jgi:Xaa-Pro aminopeptidase